MTVEKIIILSDGVSNICRCNIYEYYYIRGRE